MADLMLQQLMARQHSFFEEESKGIHDYLDGLDIPRSDGGGEYSLLYRVKLLDNHYLKCLSEIENYYLRKNNDEVLR